MAEIEYTDLEAHLASCRKGGFSSVYLAHGDPYLRANAVEILCGELVADPQIRGMCTETVEASEAGGAADAAERAGTYSFFTGPRVVILKTGDLSKLSEQDAEVLKSAVERGFPKKHHLVVQASSVDRRTGLFKEINKSGTVLNCSVPQGAKKAEREKRRRIFKAVAAKALAVHGKSLEPAAFDRIADLTGPDPGSFAAAVDKSALFAAGRTRITEDDALEVVSRSREDPIYMFTGALAEKDQDLALYYLDSLLFAGFHHAQILSAMANFIRRLSAVKGFVNSHEGGQWKPGMPFEAFKKQVMPAVTEHDRQLLQFEEKIGGALGSAGRTDTVLAKNPNSLYPVYQNFIQAGRFCAEELDSIIDLLHRADLNLKTTGYSARNVIEQAIFEICRKPGKNTGTEDFSYSR